MPELNVVQFPGSDLSDIPKCLRELADSIEAGNFGDPNQMVWVMDCGGGQIELGMIGLSGMPGAEAHLLLACAQRRLEMAGLGQDV